MPRIIDGLFDKRKRKRSRYIDFSLGVFVYPSSGDSIGNRTRVTAVKGRCLDRLTMEPYSNLLVKYNINID